MLFAWRTWTGWSRQQEVASVNRIDACLKMCRVGQNRIYTPYMAVLLVISLPKILYTHRVYMVLANPKNVFARVVGV